ncbi:unnamed protein product [Rotaria sp. Silwood1]|nr:unnamed protein product [Rotaria sp. Silwood1]
MEGPNIIYNSIYNGKLPNDPNSIYLMLSSPDVMESSSPGASFCSQYCGYHTYFSVGSTIYIYGFIENPLNCMDGCAVYNYNVSPNSDVGIDAMLSPIAHELVEAKSDPYLDAWGDSNGEENADKW